MGHRGEKLPSTASPFDIFFKYIVMSAALSENEADMLTKGREPAAKSSGKEKKMRLKNSRFCGNHSLHREITKDALKVYH